MRPSGEVHQALLAAAVDLAHVEDGLARGPTLQELAAYAKVGGRAAMNTVKNMTRHGTLRVVAQRKVPYRNRPVAEYAPVPVEAPMESPKDTAHIDMARIFSMWAQR